MRYKVIAVLILSDSFLQYILIDKFRIYVLINCPIIQQFYVPLIIKYFGLDFRVYQRFSMQPKVYSLVLLSISKLFAICNFPKC